MLWAKILLRIAWILFESYNLYLSRMKWGKRISTNGLCTKVIDGISCSHSSLDHVGMFHTIIDLGLDCNSPLTIDQLKLGCTPLLLMSTCFGACSTGLIIVWNWQDHWEFRWIELRIHFDFGICISSLVLINVLRLGSLIVKTSRGLPFVELGIGYEIGLWTWVIEWSVGR